MANQQLDRETRARIFTAIGGTGCGPMPEEDPLEAARVVVGELPDLPFLPQLPNRGPWASQDGRGSAFLADLHVDLQPAGWRLVPRPGLDERRRDSLLARDLDAFEEALSPGTAAIKTQVVGPWTLAATLELSRAGRVLADPGAVRDVCEALAEGVRNHVGDLRRRSGADIVVQVDEPLLAVVLEGGIATASGLGRLAAVPEQVARDALALVVGAIVDAGGVAVAALPGAAGLVTLAREAGFGGVAIDLHDLGANDDDGLGEALEAGCRLFAGTVDAAASVGTDPRTALAPLRALWSRLSLDPAFGPSWVVVTTRRGMEDVGMEQAKTTLGVVRRSGDWLSTEREDWVR